MKKMKFNHILFFMVIAQSKADVSVYSFGMDKQINLPRTEVTLQTPFTICTWFKIQVFQSPSVLISLANDQNNWKFSFGVTPIEIVAYIQSRIQSLKHQTVPESWTHICWLFQMKQIQFVINNDEVGIIELDEPFETFTGYIYLGGGKEWPSISMSTQSLSPIEIPDINNTDPKIAFQGTLSQPMIFGKSLEISSISVLHNCKAFSMDLISFSWFQESPSQTLSSDEMCSKSSHYLFFNKALSYQESVKACENIGLENIVPSVSDSLTLFQTMRNSRVTCNKPGLWISEGQPLSSGSCMVQSEVSTTMVPCDSKFCGGCSFTQQSMYVMRGLCDRDSIDLSFFINNNATAFKGTGLYDLMRTETYWTLTRDGYEIAQTPTLDPPIGLNQWILIEPICGHEPNKNIMLSLVSCSGEQFSCLSGQCIPLSNRCDNIVDCNDGSDEQTCARTIIPENYRTDDPPTIPLLVNVDLEVFRILSIPPEKPLSLRMQLSFYWQDERVQFLNFKPGVETKVSFDEIWAPHLLPLSIDNPLSLKTTHEAKHSVFSVPKTTDGSFLSVVVDSGRDQDDMSSLQKAMISDGSNATLHLMEFVDQDVDCDFKLTFFPMDEHICSLSLVIYPWSSSLVKINSTSLRFRYSGPSTLTDYILRTTNYKETTKQIGPDIHDGVVINFYFVRKPALYVLSVYLPSLFLVIIGNATLWISSNRGRSSYLRLQLNCFFFLCFLIMWGLSAALSPSTGHLTAVDVWLCFAAIHSLLLISVLVLLDVFSSDEDNPSSGSVTRYSSARVRDLKSLDNLSLYGSLLTKIKFDDSMHNWTPSYWIQLIARVVSPCLCAVFIVGYWSIVLYFTRADVL